MPERLAIVVLGYLVGAYLMMKVFDVVWDAFVDHKPRRRR
jgi:hypothetical protein